MFYHPRCPAQAYQPLFQIKSEKQNTPGMVILHGYKSKPNRCTCLANSFAIKTWDAVIVLMLLEMNSQDTRYFIQYLLMVKLLLSD